MAKKILLVIIALMVMTGAYSQRDTRSWDDEYLYSLGGEIINFPEGETGCGARLSYAQKLRNSGFWLGMDLRATQATDERLDYPSQLVGMDVTLGFRANLGWFYIYPQLMGGVGMVAHNAILASEPDIFSTTIQVVQRQQAFLSWECGGRCEIGAQVGRVTIGLYASYMWQQAELVATTSLNMATRDEWLTKSPWSFGANLSYHLDKGDRHHGGNNVPLVEAFGLYGNRGFEVGSKVLWNRNSGLPWLAGREPGLRGEYIASSQYGLRFSETMTDLNRLTAQVGYGLYLTPKGPASIATWRLSCWLGMGEVETEAKIESSKSESYKGSMWVIQPTLKGNLEAEFILHLSRVYFSVGGGVSAEVIPGTKVWGDDQLASETSENPYAWYASVGFGLSL